MKYIGAHVSTSGGVHQAVINARQIGATGFALFTKNQRQWVAPPYPEEVIREFKKLMEEFAYPAESVVPHDSYLINLGSPDPAGLKKSRQAFLDEVHRCEQLGLMYLNFHPGSHLNQISEEECLKTIAESMNLALNESENVILLLETTAGQGSNVGYTFEQLAGIMEQTVQPERVAVCVDTAHIYAAGYDIKEEEGYEKVWEEFHRLIGLEKLRAFHLNDSLKGLGSRVDRHAPLGDGFLGWEVFERLMKDQRFDGRPFILETPEPERWPEEVARLREWAK